MKLPWIIVGLLNWILVLAPCVSSGHAQEQPPFPLYNLRPYLQSLTSTSVLVVSQSKNRLLANLRYGSTEKLGKELMEEEPAHDHVFKIEGLEPGTRYFYEVSHVTGETYPVRSFRTLPEAGGEVTVAVIGDSGTGSAEQVALAALMTKASPDILLHVGDMAYPYGAPSYYYQYFFKIYPELLASTCIYPTLGNHDCQKSPEYWLSAFHLPANNPAGSESYYSFDAGDAHFVCLNSCGDDVPAEQVEWLKKDLSASDRSWKVVFLHHAPYSNGRHGGVDRVRKAISSVVESHGVDLVLAGHEHVYERTYPVLNGQVRSGYQDPDFVSPGGTVYVVTGGGGAPLYNFVGSPEAYLNSFFKSVHHFCRLSITPERLECRAISAQGTLIDTFTIRKQGDVPPLRFLRGDFNGDTVVNLTDAVTILKALFAGADPSCQAAGDVDASTSMTITDAVLLLTFLFQSGPAPVAPFPECGSSAGVDATSCKQSCN